MKQFKIKSPSNKTFILTADSFFHAVQMVVQIESFKYSNIDYIKINK